MQECSNVKRLYNRQLQETEHGALGIIWERHEKDMLEMLGGREHTSKVSGVSRGEGKRKPAECGGERST
eukprot:2996672-Pleurochrysis_carterae.AAC.7